MQTSRALMETAAADTGLADFGPDSFREGLEILVQALRREARLNPLGETVLRDRLLGHLKQRLLIEDWYRRHPEIAEVPLDAPLIGISLPRTGSTALSFLLAEDPQTRSLRRLEAAQPCPPPWTLAEEQGKVDHDAAMQRAANWKPHVPSGENPPAECQDLMALDFKSHIFQAFAQVPSYSEWLLSADLTPTYLYQRRALKVLQWNMPRRPWRLKCPTHLIYLQHLTHAFPDARFVMTHRDPTEVMPSVVGVYVDIVSRFTDHTDVPYLVELNLAHWSEGMRRTLAFRASGQEHRFFDIHFRAMRADPLTEVRRLYAWLQEPVTPEFEAGMLRFWRETSADRNAPVQAGTVQSDYGLDLARVRQLFADYNARMAVWTGMPHSAVGQTTREQ